MKKIIIKHRKGFLNASSNKLRFVKKKELATQFITPDYAINFLKNIVEENAKKYALLDFQLLPFGEINNE